MKKQKLAQLPRPMRIVWGCLGSWWLASMINPGFEAIALMMVFYIPILVVEFYFTSSKPPELDAEFLAKLQVTQGEVEESS